MYTYASILGWGAFQEGQIVSGICTLEHNHINILEMREACKLISNRTYGTSLTLDTDNTTLVAYIRNLDTLTVILLTVFVKGPNYNKPQSVN